MARYTRWLPPLFAVCLCFPEFLLIVASFYLILPPLGFFYRRRLMVFTQCMQLSISSGLGALPVERDGAHA